MQHIFKNRTGILPLSSGHVQDANGFIIYFAEVGNKFNLPDGIFEIDFPFEKVSPLPYEQRLEEMPIPQKYGNKSLNKILYMPNIDAIAYIQYNKGVMVLDEELKRVPSFFHDFVFLHECGHFDYYDEEKCDLYASLGMLVKGWNPSQIDACRMLLKDRKRKSEVRNNLMKFKR